MLNRALVLFFHFAKIYVLTNFIPHAIIVLNRTIDKE